MFVLCWSPIMIQIPAVPDSGLMSNHHLQAFCGRAKEKERTQEALISHRSQIINVYWETNSLKIVHDFQVNKYVPENILCYHSCSCSFQTYCFIYRKANSRHSFPIGRNPYGLPKHVNIWSFVSYQWENYTPKF